MKKLKRRVAYLFTPDKGYGKTIWTLLTLKRFFDTGFIQTGFLKLAVALFGLGSRDVEQTMVLGLLYGVFCLFLGFFWHLFKIVDAETAIGNRFNDFVKHVTRKMR